MPRSAYRLVANGVGRVCSDVMSGIMATYFSAGALLFAAMSSASRRVSSPMPFRGHHADFCRSWIIFGLTEAMFALSLRKIGFDQSPPNRQGRVQGQMASALGIGFTLGPLLGGFVGKRFGPDGLFFLYAAPQFIGMIITFVAGAHRYRRKDRVLTPQSVARGTQSAWQDTFSRFLPGDLPVVLVLGRRHARGVSVSCGQPARYEFANRWHNRVDFSSDRYAWALRRRTAMRSDQTRAGHTPWRHLGVPMFLLQVYGADFITLMLPLAIMTMGFGFTNVGSHHLRAAIGRPRRKGTQPRNISRVDVVRPSDRTISMRRADRTDGICGRISNDGVHLRHCGSFDLAGLKQQPAEAA